MLPYTNLILRTLCVLFVSQVTLFAKVEIAQIFSNGMVIQRDQKVPVWGWASPGERVTVKFAGQELGTKAGSEGNWRVDLKPIAMNKKGIVLQVIGKKKKIEDLELTDSRTYPGGCFNGMLHPLFPFAVTGVVWYQGEANMRRAYQYRKLLPMMIAEWRRRFEQADMKFYAVQLPDLFKDTAIGRSNVAELREAQAMTVEMDENAELAVIIDSDQDGNLHPKNKQLPAERLALIALAKDYQKAIEYSGPKFKKMEIGKGKVRLFFSHQGAGLVSGSRVSAGSCEIKLLSEPLNNFIVAGADKKFYQAEARIDGDSVILSSDLVKQPVSVRYAWSQHPEQVNFYNKEGLPGVPFRADDWPCTTRNIVKAMILLVH